uniref:Uncharacterized protein n=1 Tax=Oryza brachyantha TaxID=4533 RepID=J3M4Z7_ORYBR
MIGTPARVVADKLGVPFYMFFTSPWMLLSLFLHLPAIDAARGQGEHRDATAPILLPGCVPIHAHDLPSSMLADRSSETYAGLLAMAMDAATADGILVNTFREGERAVGAAPEGVKLPPVHAVGPLVWTRRPVSDDREHRCLSWLDQQPRRSVVYVSFGSGGTLTWQQTAELALGLEQSQHRFIWAIKRPDQDTPSGAFFGTAHQAKEDTTMEFLPNGFIERTRGVGLVVQSWVPQTAILGHMSIGCFVTHCGWNSTLESVSNEVPMIAWPLYAEQKMNAAMMEVQTKVAIRINVGSKRFITKKEIARAIKRVMEEGEEAERLRQCIGELKDKSVLALSKDGCSTSALAQVVHSWKCTVGKK